MRPAFVAGFGPIVRDTAASRAFWGDGLGIALWPLSQAAEACFGTDAWPADLPEPQAWMELDVETAEDVAPATAEMAGRGHRILVNAKLEPWGQTVSHLLSPEGILVGIVYIPSMHKQGEE